MPCEEANKLDDAGGIIQAFARDWNNAQRSTWGLPLLVKAVKMSSPYWYNPCFDFTKHLTLTYNYPF